MPIKSFEVFSIEGKRYSKLGERIPQLRVDHNTAVTAVTPSAGELVTIEFRFTVNYVGMGLIKLEGRVSWEGDSKSVAEQWSKTNALPNEVFSPVLSAIFTNCMPAAVVAARDLGLPPPIPPPQIQMKKSTKPPGGKDHTSSMEVG